MILQCVAAGILTVAAIGAQDAAPASPAVSPDQELNGILRRSDEAKATGNMAGAVSAAEEALKKVRGQPALKNREEEVLQRLGTAYQAAQRYPDAVRAFTSLLELRQEDCKPGPSFGERCADAEYGLGTALMYAGDFQAARGHLTVAVAGFSKMGTDGDEGYRMTKMKHKGDAESLLAAALFRSGDRVKAIEGFRRAIATLRVVESNEKADLAVRGAATNSIRDAEASLGMLEKK